MFDKELLKGKCAIVTGGGSGLGKAIAESYVQYGANVAIVGRREELLRETAESISRGGAEVLPLACDVRFEDEVLATTQKVKQRFGGVDILVNAAAGNFVYPTEKLSANAFKLIIDTVLMGSVNFTLALGKEWIDAGQPGSIINILTTYASTGSPYVLPSACAKAGVENMTKSLAAEWGKYGIRLVGIAPGPFPTEGAMKQLRLEEEIIEGVDVMKFITERIPLARIGKLEELANLATYLVSPAAEFITGEVIRIDGGEIANLSGEFSFLHAVPEEHWESGGKRLKRDRAGKMRLAKRAFV